ncbi:MAG TPA: EF-hand domain-containing protein [Pirellulales bacterium]|nr:EF-hand domain-containing protein [Pirellulales bacterium]
MKCCHWWHRILGAGMLLAASTVPAIADDDKAGKENSSDALFKQLDRNGDGEIVSDELGPEQQRMFQRLLRTNDANSDNKLSRDEFLAATKEAPPPREAGGRGEGGPRREGGPSPEQAKAIFEQLDANGDGKLVIEEVPEERRPRFAILIERADADGDKSLTLVEFTEGMAMMRGEGKPGQPGTPPPPPPPGPGDAIFKALDSNSDGKLSKDEIQAAPKSLEKLDRDGDGEITRRELGGPRPYQSASRPDGAPGEGAMPFFRRMDTNNDGKLSKDEVGERLRENFDRVDTDGDGYIQPEEMQKVMAALAGGQRRPEGGGPNGQQMLKQMDKNNDGKLSKDEVGERMRENFDRLDANSDGYIDAEELGRMLRGGRRPGGQDRPEGQGRPEGQARRDGQRPDPKQLLQRLDINKDGKLSKDEAPEWMQNNFDRFDTNGDGFVDADELAKHPPRDRQGPRGDRKSGTDGDQK